MTALAAILKSVISFLNVALTMRLVQYVLLAAVCLLLVNVVIARLQVHRVTGLYEAQKKDNAALTANLEMQNAQIATLHKEGEAAVAKVQQAQNAALQARKSTAQTVQEIAKKGDFTCDQGVDWQVDLTRKLIQEKRNEK